MSCRVYLKNVECGGLHFKPLILNYSAVVIGSDVDPHWLFMDPAPQNLMNADPDQKPDPDPDPAQWNQQTDFKPSFKNQEEKNKICT